MRKLSNRTDQMALSGGGGIPDFKFQGWSNGGQKSKPKKSLDQNLTPKKSHDEKISTGTTRPGHAGSVKNLPIVFEYPQKPT